MTSAATLSRAHRALLTGCVAAVSLAAWLWLSSMRHAMHSGSLLSALLMWLAMTLAMMTPTVLTWLLAFASFADRKAGAIAAFAAGYFAAWLGYSAVGAGLQLTVHNSGLLDPSGIIPAKLGASVLFGAGIVHLTPLTKSCLRHCRNPLTYLLQRWNGAGPPSSLRIGLAHGAYCIGCCWALMLTGFAMGLMNLAWMAALTIVICVEKLAPRGEFAARLAGIGLIAWGAVMLLMA